MVLVGKQRYRGQVGEQFRGMTKEREREYVLDLARRYWEECQTLEDLATAEHIAALGALVRLFERNGVPRRHGPQSHKKWMQPRSLEEVMDEYANQQNLSVPAGDA